VEKLRVLFLSLYNPFSVGSGPGTHLQHLAQELANLGCEVHILVCGSRTNDEDKNNVTLHFMEPFSLRSIGQGFMFSLSSIREINKICETNKIEVVHGQSPSSFGYALLSKRRLPYVVTLHGTSFGEFTSYLGVPLQCVNASLVRDAMFVQPMWAVLAALEYKWADRVIAVSKAIAKETARFYRLSEEKIVVLHNGVDLPDIPDSSLNEQNGNHTMLCVGRLIWRKGVKYLIDALPQILLEYPDAKLLLVGNGEQKTFLEKRIQTLGIANSVQFLGNVSADTLYSLYRKAGIYVQPSLYEPCAISILEAMGMGKAVVATSVGGIPELITDGKEGLLVDPKNSLQLAEGVKTIFSSASRRIEFAKNARKKVESKFTWKAIARKTLDLYEDMLENS
jgi:glycosyltransferase involved in cell wall biosynthesis